MRKRLVQELVIIIIGASSGICRATTLLLAKHGARLLIASRSEIHLQKLVGQVQSNTNRKSKSGTGPHIHCMTCDVTDEKQVKAVAEKAIELWGRIDVWIQGAAVMVTANVEDTTYEEYSRLIDVNFLGQVRGAKIALPHLKKSCGTLIHISSLLSRIPLPNMSAYSCSKSALQQFINTLRMELRQQNAPVTVTSIVPSGINTTFYETARNKVDGGKYVFCGIRLTYSPDTVAKSILYACEYPCREIIVGSYGYFADWIHAIVPSLFHRFTAAITDYIGKTKTTKFQSDNLYTAIHDECYHTIYGHCGAIQLPFSIYNILTENILFVEFKLWQFLINFINKSKFVTFLLLILLQVVYKYTSYTLK